MPALTRGPLSPGTYWRRRLFVALSATALVFVTASAFGLVGDRTDGASDQEPAARQAGAPWNPEPGADSTSPPSAAPDATATPEQQGTQQRKRKRERLATPSGRCAAGDITVTPTTKHAVAGQPIELRFALRTRTNPACHWTVDGRRLAVRITDDAGEVWSTRHCRADVTSHEIVVRRAVPTEVSLTWDARRSDDGCREATEWVLPGEYDVTAAALGGEPTERPLRLYAPGEAPTETELRAEVRTGNALERLQRRQAARERRQAAHED